MATFSQSAGAGCLVGLPIRWGQSGSVNSGTATTETFAAALADGPGIILPCFLNNADIPDLAALAISGNASGITAALANNGTNGSGPFGYITLGDQATLGAAGSYNFGEVLFQWGSQTNSSGYQAGDSYEIPFASAFPHNCWWACAVPILPAGSVAQGYAWPNLGSFTPSGITVIPSASQAGSTAFTEIGYFAIGN